MSRIKPRIIGYQRVIDAQLGYAYTGGMREALRMQADLAIKRLLKGIGPNARGNFRVRVEFWPDGCCDDE